MEGTSGDTAEPLVKARFCQEWLALVAKEEETHRGRFFARLPKETRELIESASRTAWLPLAVHVKLADILLEAFGVAGAHGYYRRAFASALQGPILMPLVLTGAKLFGLSPASFARWASRGYDASYKNAGSLVGAVLGPGRAQLVFSNLPPVCIASEAWLRSSQGSAYGVYDVLRIDGVVRIDLHARAQGRMVLDLEWSERGSPT